MTTTVTTVPRLQKISYYFILTLIILAFAPGAFLKFSNHEMIVIGFTKWNLLAWKETIAVAEIIGIIALLIPKTNLLGVLTLSGIISGAIVIHILHNEPYYYQFAILLVLWINFLIVKPKNK